MENHQKYHAAQPKFDPKFYLETNLNICSDKINRFHEDYPCRIDITSKIIDSHKHISNITESLLLSIHKSVMNTSGVNKDDELVYPLKEELLGVYRNHNVKVGGHIPSDWKLVPEQIKKIVPLEFSGGLLNINGVAVNREANIHYNELVIFALTKWYIDFQTIHPFSDGNGRVGGIVMAIMGYVMTGKFLTPAKEF